jgi:hypothetical protein
MTGMDVDSRINSELHKIFFSFGQSGHVSIPFSLVILETENLRKGTVQVLGSVALGRLEYSSIELKG